MMVLISVALLVNAIWLRSTIQKDKASTQIASGVYELNLLTSNYLLRRGEQTKIQWQLRYASLSELLSKDLFQESEEIILLKEIQQNHATLKNLFGQLVEEYDALGSEHKETQEYKNFEDLFIKQLLIKTQAMLSTSQQLAETIQNEVIETQLTTSIVIILMIFGMTGLIILVSFLLKKKTS